MGQDVWWEVDGVVAVATCKLVGVVLDAAEALRALAQVRAGCEGVVPAQVGCERVVPVQVGDSFVAQARGGGLGAVQAELVGVAPMP